ncbi:MAG: HAMP domain-containing protein [Nitrospirota bacterium]
MRILFRPYKQLSLASKFNILTIALILATSVGICIFMIRLEMTNYYQELRNYGKTIANTTAKNCELGMYTENESLLLPVLESLSADSEIAYVSIMNRQHKVLASRVFNGIKELPSLNTPRTSMSTTVDYQDLADRNGRPYLDILAPLISAENRELTDVLFKDDAIVREPAVIGYVRLGMSQEGLQKRIRQLLVSVVLFTTFLVGLGIFLTILHSRRITSPLKRLTAATKDISEGRFDIPFTIRTSDEISDLAKSFDHMRDRLRVYHAQVEERIAEEQRHIMEKEKLMMDLHDGIGGITTNISILSELAQKTTDMDGIKKTLAIIAQLSREGISEIRSFMQSLDSRELRWQVLASEIRKQGTALLEPHQIRFAAETSVEDISEQPGSLLWVNLFRIYKEALTNIIKHARAESVSVQLTVSSEGLLLEIQDNGIGWNDQANQGRGLPNMNKRALEMGGTITVFSPGKGTCIRLAVPFHSALETPSHTP